MLVYISFPAIIQKQVTHVVPLIVDTCQVSDDYTFRFPESYGDKHTLKENFDLLLPLF
jgi:hypothetical protein